MFPLEGYFIAYLPHLLNDLYTIPQLYMNVLYVLCYFQYYSDFLVDVLNKARNLLCVCSLKRNVCVFRSCIIAGSLSIFPAQHLQSEFYICFTTFLRCWIQPWIENIYMRIWEMYINREGFKLIFVILREKI